MKGAERQKEIAMENEVGTALARARAAYAEARAARIRATTKLDRAWAEAEPAMAAWDAAWDAANDAAWAAANAARAAVGRRGPP